MKTESGPLNHYLFVPQDTSGPVAAGEVWTNAAFDTIGPGSYFLLNDEIVWRTDVIPQLFAINPTGKILPPPFLTPFVLGGAVTGNGVLQLAPLSRPDGAAQGWNYTPPNDPGTTLSPASGNGIWQQLATG